MAQGGDGRAVETAGEGAPVLPLHPALDQAPFGFALIGRDGRYIGVNTMLAKLHGIAVDDFVGHTFEEAIPHLAAYAQEIFEQVVAEGAPVRGTTHRHNRPRVSRSGLIWEDIWFPVLDDAGQLRAVGVTVLEVSHLRRSHDRISTVQQVNLALARSETVADVLASLELIVDEHDGMSQQLWLTGGDGLTPVAWIGGELDRIARIRPLHNVLEGLSPDSGLPVSEVLATGEARYFGSRAALIEEFPAVAPIVEAGGVHSIAYVPLRRAEGAFGVLRWSWTEEREFTGADRRFFETIGDSFATAYQRARMREREQDERRRAEQVLEALAPLATAATTAEVAQVVTSLGPDPLGANGVSIALVDPGDPGRRIILGSVGYPEDFIDRIRIAPIDFPTPPNRVMVTSQPLYLHSPEDMRREFPHIADTLVGAGKAWAALPLRTGGRTIGALTLSFAKRQDFQSGQRVELVGYASHIAEALARALRHEEDHEVAVQVQRSLLPARLPSLPGAALTARYLPGSDLEMGGDWYDAVALADGRLFLVVGDVMGHGVEAAMAMGQLRAAARALSKARGPAEVLSELDRFVDDVENASLATLAAVVIDVGRGEVEYALAGHPPPLVRTPAGTVTRLGEGLGSPLGLSPESREAATARVEPGSLVVLYTDGLVERRGEDLGTGLGRLEAAVAAVDPADTEAAADALIAAGLEGFRQRDDIALVCLAVGGPV
jgi:serine phosphatase RsbU (regulator of sigma subunit)